MTLCRCEAYPFPHREGGGDCYGHDLADCPRPVVTPDPYSTGDHWYREYEHGCRPPKPVKRAPSELDDFLADWRGLALTAARGR